MRKSLEENYIDLYQNSALYYELWDDHWHFSLRIISLSFWWIKMNFKFPNTEKSVFSIQIVPWKTQLGKYKQTYSNLFYKYTVYPTFLTGLRYHTVTHRDPGRDRDRDLTSVQRPEMISTNSFGIFTGRSRSRSWTVTVW